MSHLPKSPNYFFGIVKVAQTSTILAKIYESFLHWAIQRSLEVHATCKRVGSRPCCAQLDEPKTCLQQVKSNGCIAPVYFVVGKKSTDR